MLKNKNLIRAIPTMSLRAIAAVILAAATVVGIGVDNAFAYVSRSCTVLVTARLSATAWQTSGTNTRMHLDLNPYTPGGTGLQLYSRKITVDGIALLNSAGAYVVNDVTINRGANTSHPVRGWWRGSNGLDYSCSVTIPSYPGY